MSAMGEMIEKRTVKTEVVPVLMDQAASTERERLENVVIQLTNDARLMEGGDARLGRTRKDPAKDPEVEAAEEQLRAHNEKMSTTILYIRFEQVPNPQWKQLQSGYPQRRNNKVDENFGYNVEGVLEKVLERFVQVARAGDGPQDEWDWSSPSKDEVKNFLTGLPSGEFNALFWAMHNLNEAKVNTDGLKKG